MLCSLLNMEMDIFLPAVIVTDTVASLVACKSKALETSRIVQMKSWTFIENNHETIKCKNLTQCNVYTPLVQHKLI